MTQKTPSLKRNAIANYIGQLYSISISILIYPFYLQLLGAEAYGLVGFFVVMQAWLGILEIGLAPTLERQVAQSRGQGKDFLTITKLVKSIESIFLVLSIIVCLIFYIFSEWIATSWLKDNTLSIELIKNCIILMAIINSFRWLTFVYKSAISGMEAQVWLNLNNVIFTSLRFLGVLVVLSFFPANALNFFIYQLLIGIIEFLVIRNKIYSYLPKIKLKLLFFSLNSITPILPFALGIAYTSSLWVLTTQFDKLVLSGILELNLYGYFTLVTIVSAGILQISSPIGRALLPRMTHMLAEGKEQAMIQLYRSSSQIVAIFVFTIALTISLFSTDILYIWTGDKTAAEWAGPILFWYALGNAFLPILMFQYYLQYTYGKLKLHILMNSFFAVIALPLMYYSATTYGAIGTGISWFALQSLFFIIWPAIIHKNFIPGIHVQWLFQDIFPIFILSLATIFGIKLINIDILDHNRFISLFIMGIIVLAALLISSLGSSAVRRRIKRKIS